MKLQKINDEEVKAIPLTGGNEDKRPIKGAALFPDRHGLYANVFLCARKNSGKTSVVYKIIKDCASKYTKVIAFVGTLYKDQNWIEIQKYCKDHDIAFEGHMSMVEDGIDILAEFLTERQIEAKQRELEAQKNKGKRKPKSPILCDSEDEDEDLEKKKRKCKTQSPDYIIILDDISTELKSKTIQRLVKENRHYLMKCIISSQHLKDMKPDSRRQIDFWLVFKHQPKEILEIIHKDSSVPITEEEFVEIYHTATKDAFSFLYIDTRLSKYRKNFNTEISIE